MTALRPFCIAILCAGFLIYGAVFVPTPPRAEAQVQVAPSKDEIVRLGETLFNDRTLSNPGGQACVSCHDPEAGYTFPISANTSDAVAVVTVVPYTGAG